MVHFAMPAQVLALFANAHFPATTEELIAHAEAGGAPADVLAVLREMPGHTFSSPDDLTLRWGFVHEFQVAESAAQNPAPTMPDAVLAATAGETESGGAALP